MTLTSLARPSYMPKYKPDASCVLYLEGQQDPQSATIKDLSGYANHGTITGCLWERLPSGLWVNNFDGTDDKISLADTPTLDITGNFTFLFWLNKTVNGLADIYEGIDVATDGIHILTSATESLIVRTYQAGANQQSYSTNFLTAGVWYFIGVTLDGASGKIWKNGVDDTTNSGVHIAPASSAGAIKYIGQSGADANVLTGKLTLFRILNIALSATQIAGIYRNERSLFGI
jgi:hypothetical protein